MRTPAAVFAVLLLYSAVSGNPLDKRNRYETLSDEVVKLAEMPTRELVLKIGHKIQKHPKEMTKYDCAAFLHDTAKVMEVPLEPLLKAVANCVCGFMLGFRIEDAEVFAIFVSALDSSMYAWNIIGGNGRRDHIYAFSDYIKPHARRLRSFGMLALCKLTDMENEEMLKAAIGYRYRSALGDTAAQNHLIARFKTEKDFNSKVSLAYELADIGTETSIRTLLLGLEDTLTKRRDNAYLSIHYTILRALGSAFPKEPLFQGILVEDRCDREYTKEVMDKFKYDVIKWAKTNFGIDLPRFEEHFFLTRCYGR